MQDAEPVGQDVSIGNPIVLAPELNSFVTPLRINQNFVAYPEIQAPVTPEQLRKIEIIKDTLLQLPLIHHTTHRFSGGDLLPLYELPAGHHNNTLNVDRSLGLDKYVFLNWGLPEKSSALGSQVHLVDPKVLKSPNTIVTPDDLLALGYTKDKTFQELPDDMRKDYEENYFGKMVSGRHWLEIIARRVLVSIEKRHPFFVLKNKSYVNRTALGEIKHFGKVDKNFIQQTISTRNLGSYYKFLYEHGFAVSDLEFERKNFISSGKRSGLSVLPEECGVDYEAASKYWTQVLE